MGFRPSFICHQCNNLTECKEGCKKKERVAPRKYDDCFNFITRNKIERVSALAGVDFRISS